MSDIDPARCPYPCCTHSPTKEVDHTETGRAEDGYSRDANLSPHRRYARRSGHRTRT